MKHYILYSGKDCHLCDIALEIITQVSPQVAIGLDKIDVKSDTELFHLYGARIPVLKMIEGESSRELAWPFDQASLAAFLQ